MILIVIKEENKSKREGEKDGRKERLSLILNINTHTYIMCDKISHEANQYLGQSTLRIVCSAKL